MTAAARREIALGHIRYLEMDIRNWTRRLPHFVDQEQTRKDIAHAKAEIERHKASGGVA